MLFKASGGKSLLTSSPPWFSNLTKKTVKIYPLKIHALPAIIYTSFVYFDNMYPDHKNLGNKTWEKKKKIQNNHFHHLGFLHGTLQRQTKQIMSQGEMLVKIYELPVRNKFSGSLMYNLVTIVIRTVFYTSNLLRVHPKHSHNIHTKNW